MVYNIELFTLVSIFVNIFDISVISITPIIFLINWTIFSRTFFDIIVELFAFNFSLICSFILFIVSFIFIKEGGKVNKAVKLLYPSFNFGRKSWYILINLVKFNEIKSFSSIFLIFGTM